MRRKIATALSTLALTAATAGCAGTQARSGALSPAMVNAWPGVRADAAAGIAADSAAGRAPESISLRAERLKLFDQAMTELAK